MDIKCLFDKDYNNEYYLLKKYIYVGIEFVIVSMNEIFFVINFNFIFGIQYLTTNK